MLKGRRFWRYFVAGLLLLAAAVYWFPGPRDPFSLPQSTVLLDRSGDLLGARIAADGQWRFPPCRETPEKFAEAVVHFEDRHFYLHPGVNPFSIVRAAYQNIKNHRVVSGGSTLSMQVVRLSRKGKPRTVGEKLLEMALALRLEMRHSKKEILAMYASNAPFGGNVVGVDAASWRYFGMPADRLSWAEAAALAVLPNAPALIHPGRNREQFQSKRDRLLLRLFDSGTIDSLTYRLSLVEPLPAEPLPLPQRAPHLLGRTASQMQGKTVTSPVIGPLQDKVSEIVSGFSGHFALNGIHNAAALVISVNTGEVLAYVGNVPGEGHGNEVDVIRSLRSPGSLLKPVLFAAMIEEGSLLPATLLPDIPTIISGYSPKNFTMGYEGAVPAKRALEKSLNIPAVRMLREYKYERFHHLLQELGITSLSRPADHYGLSLILGGAEMSLWDLCGMYASMARVLNHYYPLDGKYSTDDIHPPLLTMANTGEPANFYSDPPLSAAAIMLTFQSLLEVNRPAEESGWEYFASSRRIAWKTGTSFGFRDGWAVGTTPEYVVGVWVGNADGEGRPGLTGIGTAAPALFTIYDALRETSWFDMPYDEMEWVAVCRKSGHLATGLCTDQDSAWIHHAGLNTLPCPYHKLIHTDLQKKFRVNLDCVENSEMTSTPWFVLPPVMEWYYKLKDPSYLELPPFKPGCKAAGEIGMLQFIYPEEGSRIYVPVELDGSPGKAIFELAHRKASAKVFWHIDNEFIGSTRHTHQLAIRPSIGDHTLRVIDEQGYEATVRFRVESRDR
jgi:penicillin-binding protein 1C